MRYVRKKVLKQGVKAGVKHKTNSVKKDMKEGMQNVFEDDKVEEPIQIGKKKKRKPLSEARLKHFQTDARQWRNFVFNITFRSKKWEDWEESDGISVQRQVQRIAPVSAWLCKAKFVSDQSLKTVVRIFHDRAKRRQWDDELLATKGGTLHELGPGVTLEHIVHDSSLGGLVSSRDYVDVRAVSVEGNKAYIWWGSVEYKVLDENCVRGWNYPSGCLITTDGENNFTITLMWHRDYKGWLPYSANEKGMPGAIRWKVQQFISLFAPQDNSNNEI